MAVWALFVSLGLGIMGTDLTTRTRMTQKASATLVTLSESSPTLDVDPRDPGRHEPSTDVMPRT